MTTLLIRPSELTRSTIIGGNVDIDRYLVSIKSCQKLYIKPLLGETLYNKILLDFENNALIGLYRTMFDEYIKELVIHGSAEIYLQHGAYMVSNNGITKTKTDSSETVSKEEIDYLVQASRKLYNLYEREFIEWIKDKNIPEYKGKCDKSIRPVGSWFLRKK